MSETNYADYIRNVEASFKEVLNTYNVGGNNPLHTKAFDLLQAYNSMLSKLEGDGYTKRDIDAAYVMGAFNVGGVDGLSKECDRLIELGVNPSDIVDRINSSKQDQ